MKGRIVVVAASLHGIDALRQLVGALPADFPAPVFIVQHLGKDSLGFLPGILGRAGPLPADHPAAREKIVPGRIYVAPPDRHMLLEEGYVLLSQGPRENWVRPAADPLFRSAALAYGAAAIGVVLTGSLDDGTAGLLAIKDAGGTALVQDPQEALAPSMPRSALRHVAVDQCLPIAGLARNWCGWRATIPRRRRPPPIPPSGASSIASPAASCAARTGANCCGTARPARSPARSAGACCTRSAIRGCCAFAAGPAMPGRR